MRSPGAGHAQTLAGRYRVIRPLGSGGMASVVLAEDERLGRQVAVKRLPTSSPEDASARFRREARLGASLNHPNVVSIYDSTTDEDSLLIVMEYVEGESLKEQLLRGPLPPERVAAITSQIGSALDNAHAAGVIHRDVKPSNVLIAADGSAKLADLGIATAADVTSITTTNDVIGTLTYIAPERLESAPDDASADVYSLAAVAFEALSGEKAQAGRTPSEIVTGRARELHEAWPHAPAAAADVLREGMAREPGRRPGSAGELAGRLSAALTDEVTAAVSDPEATATLPVARPTTTTEPAPSAPATAGRSRRVAISALLAALAGVAIAAVVLSDGGGDDPAPRDTAAQNTSQQPQTTEPEPEPAPEPEPLTGTALGSSLNEQGKALIDAGDPSAAIPILQQAVEAFPDGTTEVNYAFALFNLGNALRLAGQPEEAIPILEQRLEIPNQVDVVAEELELAIRDAAAKSSSGDSSGGVSPEGEEASGGVTPGGSSDSNGDDD